jgi:hypothetical protein
MRVIPAGVGFVILVMGVFHVRQRGKKVNRPLGQAK